MDRRKFIKSVTGAATLAAAGAVASRSASASVHTSNTVTSKRAPSQTVLRVGLVGPANPQGLGDFFQQFAARVRAASDDTLVLESVDHTDHGVRAVARGDVACYCAIDHDHLDQAPELAFFSGLPGQAAITPDALQTWLTGAGGQAHWDAVAADFGIKPLAIAHTGPVSHIWSRAPISRLEDLLGREIYGAGLAGDIVRGLGGHAISGHLSDLAKHKSLGRLFAAEVGGIPMALASGLPQTFRFAATPGVANAGNLITFGMNRTIWDRLSNHQRTLLEAAATATYHDTRGFLQSQHAMMAEACAQRFQTQFIPLPRDVTDAVARVSDTLVAHLAASSPRAAQINASYMSYRRSAGLIA